jgi:hypothetical protein
MGEVRDTFPLGGGEGGNKCFAFYRVPLSRLLVLLKMLRVVRRGLRQRQMNFEFCINL